MTLEGGELSDDSCGTSRSQHAVDSLGPVRRHSDMEAGFERTTPFFIARKITVTVLKWQVTKQHQRRAKHIFASSRKDQTLGGIHLDIGFGFKKKNVS